VTIKPRHTTVAALLAIAGSTYAAYAYLYRAPLDEIRAETASLQASTTDLRDDAIAFADLARNLDTFARSTIASDAETMETRLRAVLNQLTREAGLDAVRTDTDVRRPAINPASDGRLGEFRPASRGEESESPSFTPVRASISGVGTIEQALRAVALLESQPWPKRITQLRLKPQADARRAAVAISFETLFMPDLPGPEDAPDLAAISPEARARIAEILNATPFSAPPAPPTEPPPTTRVEQEPDPPPPPPYHLWTVTGVTATDDRTEVWITNRNTNETRKLMPGQEFLGIALLEARGTAAVFTASASDSSPTPFAVPLGADLNTRNPPTP
jgi:hypothetical protein